MLRRAFSSAAARASHFPARVRYAAPAFKAPAALSATSFKDVSLSDYKGKWVVLFFYPLDFTFVCPTEITAFSDRIAEFRALKAEVVGVSVDSQFSHAAWLNTPRNKGGLGKLEFPLVADITKNICRDYGVLVEDAADGLNGVALRGTFIIDPKGTVRNIQITDEAVGRSVDEVLRLLQAFQYVEKHGEVCPSDWKPGKKTMKADVVKSQEYFAELK